MSEPASTEMTIVTSERFPEGYGDFVLQSSDGVQFHVPKYIMSHSSPVFKDMFSLCEPGENSTDPLPLPHESTTLDLFLCHIDPCQSKPQFNIDNVANLLEMAENTTSK